MGSEPRQLEGRESGCDRNSRGDPLFGVYSRGLVSMRELFALTLNAGVREQTRGSVASLQDAGRGGGVYPGFGFASLGYHRSRPWREGLGHGAGTRKGTTRGRGRRMRMANGPQIAADLRRWSGEGGVAWASAALCDICGLNLTHRLWRPSVGSGLGIDSL